MYVSVNKEPSEESFGLTHLSTPAGGPPTVKVVLCSGESSSPCNIKSTVSLPVYTLVRLLTSLIHNSYYYSYYTQYPYIYAIQIDFDYMHNTMYCILVYVCRGLAWLYHYDLITINDL